MSTITDLVVKVQSLRDKLHAAENALERARINACIVKVGGDVVVSNGEEYRVCRIRPIGGGIFWLHGNKKLKDGSWGTGERSLYSDWKVRP